MTEGNLARDPERRVLAVDLPGHGRSPAWPSYDFEGVAEEVHRAARHAELHRPVLVGHSAGAVVATIYASRYPARGVVNVDQWLRAEPLARLFQSLADQLRGPGFQAAWEMVEASMSIGLLPKAAQELLRSARNPRHVLPQATITVWPASGHFPHLAHPRRFAECLAATARRSTLPRQPAYIGPRTTYSEPAQ